MCLPLLSLDDITGQDVFDALGNVVGKVVDGVVKLQADSGISNADIFDAAKNVIGKVGEVVKSVATSFGTDLKIETTCRNC